MGGRDPPISGLSEVGRKARAEINDQQAAEHHGEPPQVFPQNVALEDHGAIVMVRWINKGVGAAKPQRPQPMLSGGVGHPDTNYRRRQTSGKYWKSRPRNRFYQTQNNSTSTRCPPSSCTRKCAASPACWRGERPLTARPSARRTTQPRSSQ